MKAFTITLVLLGFLTCVYAGEKEANNWREPLDIIQKEGVLCISDGSSFYIFRKDGSFESTPVGMSGREIKGTWTMDKGNQLVFKVEGLWTWINGISPRDDFREMTFALYPLSVQEKEIHHTPWRHPSDIDDVYRGYFIIEELKKKEANPVNPNEDKRKWVEQCLKDFEAIKVGMTLKEVEAKFTHDGGVSRVTVGRFQHPSCSYFKIDVTFEPLMATNNIFLNDQAKVIKVGTPYLQPPYTD